jgi:hypothetical protein
MFLDEEKTELKNGMYARTALQDLQPGAWYYKVYYW